MEEHLPHKVDKLFRDSLQSYPDAPSGAVWERIEQQLDKEDRRVYLWRSKLLLRLCACLFVLVIALGIVVLLQYRQPGAKPAIAINPGKPAGTAPEIQPATLPGINNLSHINKAAALNPAADNRVAPAGKTALPYLFPTPASLQHKEAGNDVLLTAARIGPPPVNNLPVHINSIPLPAPPAGNAKKTMAAIKLRPLKRFSVTAYFSQEFAGYNLSDNDATAPNGSEIEKKERNVFSATGGIYFNYQPAKHWVLQSGLGYSWSRSIIDPSESFAVNAGNGNVRFKVTTNSGYGYMPASSATPAGLGDSALTDKVYSNLHYLTVPLLASYKFGFNRFTVLAGAGVTFNFLTDATVETKLFGPSFSRNSTVVAMNGLKKINCGIMFKAELQYTISSNWGISMIPCFKNTLSPINIHTAVSAYPYDLGIGLGITYRF